MPAVRGRKTALIAALVFVSVLGLCGIFEDRLYEAWYIHQIETGSRSEVGRCGARLEEIATRQTIPALLGLLRRRKALILQGESEVSRAFFRCMTTVGPRGMAATILALDEEERTDARRSMLRFNWRAGRSAALGCLRDPHPVVRLEAIETLYRNYQQQSEDKDPAPLLELRQDPVKEVRRAAAFVLARRFPGDLVVRRELRGALKDADRRIRRKAATALAQLRSRARLALPELIEALQDPDTEVRTLAAEALGQSGCEDALDPLTKALGDPLVAREAESSLWFLADLCDPGSPAAAAAVSALLLRLESPANKEPSRTLSTLGEFGPAARGAVPFALKQLSTRSDRSECAIRFLGAMGPPAAPAVPQLIEALKDPQVGFRKEATRALGGIGKEAISAVPALTEVLRQMSLESEVPWEAARALGFIGSLNSVARGALLDAVRKEGSRVDSAAAEALAAAANTEEALREVLEILHAETSSEAVRSAVIRGLARRKTFLTAALPTLIRVIREPTDSQGGLWHAAAGALGELGPEAAEAVPTLERALSRTGLPPFAEALRKIDPRYAPLAVRMAIERLLQGRGDVHSNLYAEARTLADLGRDAVPELAGVLGDGDVIIRAVAAEALGRIGPGAEAAVPALERALSDEDDEVRRGAAKALGKIRGSAAAPTPPAPAPERRP